MCEAFLWVGSLLRVFVHLKITLHMTFEFKNFDFYHVYIA